MHRPIGMTLPFRRPTVSAPTSSSSRNRFPGLALQGISAVQWSELGTLLARAALAGFAVFLLALASHGA
jgi:hypothetical protein